MGNVRYFIHPKTLCHELYEGIWPGGCIVYKGWVSFLRCSIDPSNPSELSESE